MSRASIHRRLLMMAAIAASIASAAAASDDDLDSAPVISAAPASATATTQPSDDSGAALGEDAPELMLFKDMPVVVAAGRRQQTQQQAAAAVSVVTADDIALFNYESIADVLRGQRSFYIHSDGLNDFAGVRGFLRAGEWNARILVLVDGKPTNEMIYGQTHIDKDFVVPIEAVKQIEIVRGPGSALYGSNAVFAVINVVTKDGADVNGVQAKVEGGTQDTGRVSALIGGKTRSGWDILASVSAYTSQGDDNIKYDGINDPAQNDGHILNSDYEGAEALFLKAKKSEFTAELDFENRQKDNRAATYDVSFFNPGSEHEERANAAFHFDHEIEPGQSLHAMLYYGSYHYEQGWRNDFDVPQPYQYHTRGNDDWVGEEVHYDWQINDQLHLLTGAEGAQSLYTYQHDSNSLTGNLLRTTPSFNTAGIFTESEFKLTKQLTIVAGGRVDQVQRIGVNFSPRAAVILEPTPQDVVKALYGRAFRSPNLYEQFYNVAGFNQGNPNLHPEICDTYETVWDHEFQNGWRTTLDGYLWRLSHAMDDIVLADGDVQTQNVGTTWAHGIEAEVDKTWDTGARLRVYGTFTRDEHDSNLLTNSPQWIAGASIAIPVINPRTFLAIEPQIVGPQKNDLGEYTQSTYLTNIVLTSREFAPGWDLQAGAYDIFSNGAKMPRDSVYNQYQPFLNYPTTKYLISLTHRF
jgi:outer membrane receptor for ferrienterochelin and colicins